VVGEPKFAVRALMCRLVHGPIITDLRHRLTEA
jgi:hypothetical protein